ncbi:MAG TPA: hypothetical protein VEK79_20400 [Thermoanaerobaculia bacterium]|nr:hypothetical protein [Thermoanaerobaculia bacterium]
MFDERVLRVAADAGTSVLVGSADSNAIPACCRGIAVSTDGALTRATVYVPVATSRDIVANAAATRKLAVMITRVVEHVGVQLKGTVQTIRLAGDDEAPFVRGRLNEFADVLDEIGLPRRIFRSVAHWPAFAIEMNVEEVFDQTPGPRAGASIR